MSFFETLQEIHEAQKYFKLKRIEFQREPRLGGQVLDLQRIFDLVQKDGGYQRVTDIRGWKKIGDSFELNSRTNSAFFFKNLYKKHLLVYENMTRNGLSVEDAVAQWVLERSSLGGDRKRQRTVSDQAKVITLETHRNAQNQTFSMVDDGKDEKYLQGGWQNRLALALKSNLPNEVDWAFSKLIKLSFQHFFYVGFIPSLPESLLDHAMPFFNQLQLNTSPYNFETSVQADLEECTVPQMTEMAMFNIKEQNVMLERVLQVLHIIRNMSFMNENAIAFSRDHKLLTILAKAMALPSVTFYMEVQQNALDIFENIARLLILRGTSDFYLACLKKMIFDNDRARIIGGLRSMVKLLGNEMNEKFLLQIDTPVLQRILQLLLVPDEEIVTISLEFFYLFTNISPDAGVRITGCVRFNVLKLLLKFIHWNGVSMQKINPTILRHNSGKHLIPPSVPAFLDPRAVDPFHAAMWLQTKCIVDNTTLSHDAFYEQYITYCGINSLNPVSLSELLKLTVKFYKESAVSNEPPLIYGVKPAPPENENLPHSLACGIDNCGVEFDSPKELLEHVTNHQFRGTKCQWKKCGINCKTKIKLLHHLLTHIPRDQLQTHSNQNIELSTAHRDLMQVGDDLKGIPLCALLVIRNIAKNPQNHGYFAPFEKDLSTLLAFPKFNKTAASIFAELR